MRVVKLARSKRAAASRRCAVWDACQPHLATANQWRSLEFLLDTNIISKVAKPRPNTRVLNWLLAHEMASGIPSVAVAEQYQGAHDAPKDQRVRLLAEVDAFIREFGETVVPFDAEAAKVWGEYVSRPALKHGPRSYQDTNCRHCIEPGVNCGYAQYTRFPGSARG